MWIVLTVAGILLITPGHGMIMPIKNLDGSIDTSSLLSHIALLEQMIKTNYKSSKDEVTQVKSQLNAETTDLKSQLATAVADLTTTKHELDLVRSDLTSARVDIGVLQNQVNSQNVFSIHNKSSTDLSSLHSDVAHLKTEFSQLVTSLHNTSSTGTVEQGGATFTRWGRTTCPGDSNTVYKGYTGGTWYDNKASSASILCLPENPLYVNHTHGSDVSYIYGTEYETAGSSPFGSLNNEDMPCVVCESNTRRSAIMVPARNQCHQGWTLEYSGYLMGGGNAHASAEYICVDEDAEAIRGGHEDKDGQMLYLVTSKCGSLTCPPYFENWTLSCAVCSH